MRIEIRLENGTRWSLPAPNVLVSALVKHTASGGMSAGQCRELIDGLRRYRKVLGGEPLVSYESESGRQDVKIWL